LATAKVIEGVESLDAASLPPEALVQRVGWVVRWCTDQLQEVRDLESARAVGAALEEVLDAADGLVRQGMAELPNRAQIQAEIKDARLRFAADPSVAQALEPALDRLSALLD